MKLKQWLTIWLDKYQKNTIKIRTYSSYQNLITIHINPILGDYELNQLDSSILQDYINNKIEHGNIINGKGLSTNSILAITSILKNSLKLALKLDLVEKDYFSVLSVPYFKQKEIDAFFAVVRPCENGGECKQGNDNRIYRRAKPVSWL